MNLKILLTFDEVACSRRGRQTSLLKNALLWWALLPLQDLYLRTADDIVLSDGLALGLDICLSGRVRKNSAIKDVLCCMQQGTIRSTCLSHYSLTKARI